MGQSKGLDARLHVFSSGIAELVKSYLAAVEL